MAIQTNRNEYVSGRGSKSIAPPEIQRWNWGGFLSSCHMGDSKQNIYRIAGVRSWPNTRYVVYLGGQGE